MANEHVRESWTIPLHVVMWTTIVGGFVMATGVLVRHRGAEPVAGRNATTPATAPGPTIPPEIAAAPSACGTGASAAPPGARAMLHAWLDGAELPAEPSGPEPTLDVTMTQLGATLYAKHCATCHGAHGEGHGPSTASLAEQPTDLRAGTYELRSTEHEALPTDVDLFRTITRGIHGTAMPPWLALPEHDRWALVAYVKTLSKAFEDDEAPPPIEIPPAPAATPARLAHGKQLYVSGGCASCHGDHGRGDGPAAASLHYSSGAPATPRDFVTGRFHRSSRVGDVYLTIEAGLDGTPMGSFAKVLSHDDVWDLSLYINSLAPRFVDQTNGLRCTSPEKPDRDEIVGVATLMHSLAPLP